MDIRVGLNSIGLLVPAKFTLKTGSISIFVAGIGVEEDGKSNLLLVERGRPRRFGVVAFVISMAFPLNSLAE